MSICHQLLFVVITILDTKEKLQFHQQEQQSMDFKVFDIRRPPSGILYITMLGN